MAERKQTPQDRWQKKNTVSFTVHVMRKTEADILRRLNAEPNKAGYIKRLIRQDIAAHGPAGDPEAPRNRINKEESV